MSLSLTLSPVDVKRRQSLMASQPDDQPVGVKQAPRALGELGAEINAIEQLIDARQRLLSTETAESALSVPSINASPLPDSASSGAADTQSAAIAGDDRQTTGWTEYFGGDVLPAFRDLVPEGKAVALAVALLAVFGFIWYLRRKSARPSRYRSVGEAQGGAAGGPPLQLDQNIFPPEYGMLEEAEIYLRFGHGKLAEEALKEAIRLNPENPHAYLTLLRLYFSREDRASFAALAQQLHTLGDQSSWQKATEMGRTMDADNPLYH